MPDEIEQTGTADADEAPVPDEAASETGEPSTGDEPAPAEDAPKPGPPSVEEPFDAKRAKDKIAKANSEAANLRKRLRELEPLAQKAKEYEDAQKSEAERLNDRLAEANDRVAQAQQRVARSAVQALAASGFADPDDALGALDPATYIDSGGDVDEAAIRADLDALLERKPHWAKPQPQEGPRRPAPDRTQASGANQQRTRDPAEEFAGFLQARLKGR